MVKIIKHDENMPVGKLKRVIDVLPPPDGLVLPKKTMKVVTAPARSTKSNDSK